MRIEKPRRVTEDDPDTLDMLYEQTRINSLPEAWQRVAVNHQLDQWNARPTVVEQNARELKRNSLRR
jgi:hypothetical protein